MILTMQARIRLRVIFISDYVKAHSDIPVFSAESKDEVMKELETKLQKEDWVLVKGSRGMKMDEVVKRLIKE